MKRLVLVRHTTPDAAPGLCYGRLDLGLARSYHAELDLLTRELRDRNQLGVGDRRCRVFASPLRRCRQLAEDLAETPICIDADLVELDFGEWEGRLWSDIPQEQRLPWTQDFVEAAPPAGESFRQLEQRALRFLHRFLASELDFAIAVTHSGVMRALRCWSRQEELSQAFDLPLPYGTILEIGG